MKLSSTLLCVIFATALTGCVPSTPPPSNKELQSYQEFSARRLDSPEVRAFIGKLMPHTPYAWPPVKWQWEQLYLAALCYQPDLDVARSQFEVAKAGEVTADEIPNPSVSLSPTHDKNNTLSGFNPWVYPLNLTIPIELGGKRTLRVKNAEKLSEAARLHLTTMAWEVRSRVRQAFIDLYAAGESVQLIRQQAEAQKAVISIFDERHALGQGFSLSESQQRIAYQQAVLSLKDAEKQQTDARIALASAIGVPTAAVESIGFEWSGMASTKKWGIPHDFKEQALKHHSQLLAALAEYSAAHAAFQMELAKQIPDLNLGPGYEWNAAGDKFILGFSVTLPIFNHNEGAIAQTEAKRKEAADRFNALQAKLISDMDMAAAHYKAALEKQTVAEQLSATQNTQLQNLSAHLGQGEVAKLPLLLARTETSAMKLALHETHVQSLKAQAEIETTSEYPLSGSLPDAPLTERPRRQQ